MIPVRVSATLSETTPRFGREPDNIVHTMFMKSVVAWSLRFVRSELGAPAVRSCRRLGLARCECKPYPAASGDREHVLEFMEDFDYGSDEAEAPERSRPGVGSCWRVFVAGERRIGGNRQFGDGHAVEGYRDGPRDLLSARRRSPTSAWERSSFSTRRTPALRGSVSKWPVAAEVAAAAEAAEVAVAAPEVAAAAGVAVAAAAACRGVLAASANIAGRYRHGRVRSGSTRPSCVGCSAAKTHFAFQCRPSGWSLIRQVAHVSDKIIKV